MSPRSLRAPLGASLRTVGFSRAKFPLLLLAASACATDGTPDTEGRNESATATSQPIVAGQVDSGHPYAVALTVQGQAFCSGTLVSPTVVVSAAHCIFPGIGVDPPEQIEIFFGTSVGDGGAFDQVTEGKYFPTWNIDDPAADQDISVLRLAEPAPVAWIKMGKVPKKNDPVTLIGFGITSAGGGGAGTKRVVGSDVFAIHTRTFEMALMPGGTCNGDSGGTAIFEAPGGDEFVGIHTRSDCESGMLDERVDVHVANFIQPFIDVDATCALDAGCAKGCSMPDPDCACASDGFCTAACANPVMDPDCDAACGDDGTCAKDCPIPDPDCPVCVADGECVAACTDDPDCDGEGGAGGASSGSHGPPVGGGDPPSDGCACHLMPKLRGGKTSGDGSSWGTLAIGFAAVGLARRRRRGPAR